MRVSPDRSGPVQLSPGQGPARAHETRIEGQTHPAGPLAQLLHPDERLAPIVTVHDAASHAMAWMGSVFGARTAPIGVDGFGQSGSIRDVFRVHDLDPGRIVNAALAMVDDHDG